MFGNECIILKYIARAVQSKCILFFRFVSQKYSEFLLCKAYFFNLLRLLSYSMSKVLTLKQIVI